MCFALPFSAAINPDCLKALHQQVSLAFGIIKYCFLKLELRCHHPHLIIDARNVAK